MRASLGLLVLALLASCDAHKTGEVVSHVPLTINRITYQWPIDSTTDFDDLGHPDKWHGVGYIPAGIWNAVMSAVPGLQRSGYKGQIAVGLHSARSEHWQIQPDGKGLPFSPNERFEVTERAKDFTVGKNVGEGIASPPVVITFNGEQEAYAICSAPSRPNPTGTCNLLLNDRGVEHMIPLGWDNWKNAKAVLLLYRALLSIPV